MRGVSKAVSLPSCKKNSTLALLLFEGVVDEDVVRER
jgi:hypothetical protein